MTVDVLFVAPLPPPVHGASLISEAVLTRLRDDYPDISIAEVPIPGGRVDSVRSLSRKTLAYVESARAVRSAAPRIVYVSLPAGLSGTFLMLLAGAFRLVRWRGQLILHHHSSRFMEESRRGRIIAALYRALSASVKQPPVHFCLYGGMATAATRFKGSGAVLSNAAFDTHFLQSATRHSDSLTDERVEIGHLSNLTFDKGLRSVLRIGLSLPRDGSVTLSLAGPAGEAEEVEIREAIAAAPEVIRWHGPLYGEDKAQFYAKLDLFLFLSDIPHEGEPVVVLEAMASDVPIVATQVGGVAEMVGDSGLIYASSSECEANVDDWLTGFQRLTRPRATFEARKAAANAVWRQTWDAALAKS